MALREEFEKHGDLLFRWRSYLPISIIPVLIASLPYSAYGQKSGGKGVDLFIEIISIAVSFSGFALRCLTIGYAPSGTSGRNTRHQRAAVLNMTGIYSTVRHPLYLGNFLIMAGGLVFVQVWWFALIALLAFWLYYERIMFREEEFLRERFGASYLEWAAKTPAFLPKVGNWHWPAQRYSWKTVLRREYSGFFCVIVLFTVLEITQDLYVLRESHLDMAFCGLYAMGLGVYLTFRTLKKRTRLLEAK